MTGKYFLKENGEHTANDSNLSTFYHKVWINNRLGDVNKLTSNEIYRHLIQRISTQPTARKTIPTKLQAIHSKVYVIDGSKVSMLPRKVTMDSASRNFQYRALNNIVYFNEQLFKMNLSDNPYCSFRKNSYESVKHVFSECSVIQKVWNKLGEWLSPELNLLALTPQNAILGISPQSPLPPTPRLKTTLCI